MANSLMNTIERNILYSMHFYEYTVNIQGLLQCGVDEEIFVWRSEEQRAVTDCQGSMEEVSCVQGQQMMRPMMQVTGEQVSWCSKQYTNSECT